jgi:hypothetical protein
MAAEIIPINPQDFSTQVYEGADTNLISTFEVTTNLSSSSYIEYFVYDNNQTLLSTDYNFSQYTIQNSLPVQNNAGISQIIIDPEASLISNDFSQGEYITYYNFFNKEIGSELQQLYISEISSDRTEIRLNSTSLSGDDIVEQTNNLITQRNDSQYFLDFYLNFGDNALSIANNIQLDNTDPNAPTILIKLYDALPEDFDLNSPLWVVTSIEESTAYKVTFEDDLIIFEDTSPLKGPNFNLDVKDQVNNSTVSLDYTSLTTTTLTSSFNQLSSLLEEKEIDINIDYSDFSNFIHFSSVQTRIENFYYKVSLIEEYNSNINLLNAVTTSPTSTSNSIATYESKINNLITNFDGYEYYLYYETGSTSWPKTTTEKPYELALSDSLEVQNWLGSINEYSPLYGGIILSASVYDNTNKDNLLFTIPEYLRDDAANEPYELFVEMVAQHYDNIWVYYKDVTQKYNADNRLENGISKDIVADAIRDFGIKLYQNNFSNEDLYTAFLGLTPEGGLFPFPNITGSLPTPSGYEYVNTLISASNDYIPLDDVNKSLYKRIYHNLPYLLKAKGTIPGLRALITSYGIPDTILRINEYGGKDKSNTNDWDYWQNEFNYAFTTTGSNFITTPWNSINPSWNSQDTTPSTLTFRFKTNGLSSTNFPYSQSLWKKGNDVHLVLKYTGSGYTSGSYSGSIVDPYNQYALLDFYPNYTTAPNESSSLYLPFFDGGWWTVMVTRDGSSSNFTLSSGNKIYEGGDNDTLLGFYSSSSITSTTDADWYDTGNSYFASSSIINGKTYNQFSGSIQEIRYYNTRLSESMFKDYIMNPSSIEGNSLNNSPNQLIFRLPLGGELYTGSISIHPKITGSWVATSSFVVGSSASFNSTPEFVPNTEYFFYDQPAVGIKNAVSDKIRLENDTLPSGDTLSAIRALAQQPSVSSSYTPNTNLLEVAFSPQDEINEDIMDQIGYFNIGELIGDPRLRSSSATSYPDLDNLRNEYFEKYTKNYDLVDFIRLIKFFDNSLFKMIKDFVPARTSLASGIVIKQHLLERNKYPQPQADINSTIAYGSSGSINNIPLTFQNIVVSGTVAPQWNDYNEGPLVGANGGTGGSFERFNSITNISQSWYETIPTLSGSVITLHDSQEEFYDGEFSGSVLTVTTQSLHTPYPLNNQSFGYTPVRYSNAGYNISNFLLPSQIAAGIQPFAESRFLSPQTTPSPGQILLLTPYGYMDWTGDNSILSSPYVKIHKFDNNNIDNSIALGQLTQLLIQYTTPITYYTLNVLSISEYSTYYLYEVNTLGSNTQDNYILDYNVSSSTTSSLTLAGPNLQTLVNFSETTGNINNYFNTSSGNYTSSITNNVALYVSASALFEGSSGGGANFIIKVTNVNGTITNLATTSSAITPANPSMSLAATYYAMPGDSLKLQVQRTGGTPIFLTGSINVTQSSAPSAEENDSIIIEPYITNPNYYNSDDNPTINNINNDRLSTVYQDVDYSTGITTPTNFGLLISGSALKAAVQDSNYSSKRVTLPRYEGSRSTSQKLNTWSSGDEGTYGKLPTVESLKTAVAYCEGISGWTPERMNSSALQIKYLIKSDGTVVIPNTTPNSLSDNKGTFETGENVEIQFQGIGGQITPLRKIIRGGTRIEPILYNQSGSYPGNWLDEITLTDKNIPGGIISDFQAVLSPTTFFQGAIQVWGEANFGNIISSGSASNIIGGSTKRLKITSGMITEGISLTLKAELKMTNNNHWGSGAYVQFKNFTSGATAGWAYIPLAANAQSKPLNSTIFLNYNELVVGDEWGIEVSVGENNMYYESTSRWTISQSPSPNATIPTTGLWLSGSGLEWDNVLYTTSSLLRNSLTTNNVYQENIPGSGFNQIQLPWSLEIGDEFRFEGREDRVLMVKDIHISSSTLLVELNQPIFPSGSMNLDHFLIRRYVDDATTTIIEGFKPDGSSAPYIVKPQYVVPELDRDIDSFILDLTQKGLL